MTDLGFSFSANQMTVYAIVMTILLLLLPVLVYKAIKSKNGTYLTMVAIIVQLLIAPYVYLAIRIGSSRLAEML